MNNESYDFEDRKYVNPTLSRDEQLSFVDNFRNMQQSNMNQIARDTHNLGTDVPSNLGGLTGSERLWNASYVAPKVNSMVSGLRATAQAKALNDVLGNYQEQMKKRYNDAYMAAQRRASGGDNPSDDDDDDDDSIDYTANDTEAPNSQGNIDTVTKRNGPRAYTNPNAPESSLPDITSGGKLPSSGGAAYYLVAPDGSRSQIVITKNMSGVSMDAFNGEEPMYSIGGSENIRNRLGDLISRGYRIQRGSQDITSTYGITMGL